MSISQDEWSNLIYLKGQYMDVNNGNLLSMVSLPDFNLNKRQDIKDKKYINNT